MIQEEYDPRRVEKGVERIMKAAEDEGCFTCQEYEGHSKEIPEPEKCPKSKRPCGHHCNCTWTQDVCCWCGKEFDGE